MVDADKLSSQHPCLKNKFLSLKEAEAARREKKWLRPEETKRTIGKYTKTTDQEDLQETYQTFVKVWERVPYVSSAAVQNVLNFAKHPAANSISLSR
jgi:hypothetical protein